MRLSYKSGCPFALSGFALSYKRVAARAARQT